MKGCPLRVHMARSSTLGSCLAKEVRLDGRWGLFERKHPCYIGSGGIGANENLIKDTVLTGCSSGSQL